MEERLIEAATLGRVDLLNATEAEEFVNKLLELNKLLQLNPMFARLLDLTDRTALHLASARGDVNVVKELIKSAPEMCLARDRDGRNPVHVAAMNGHVDVLKELVQANPYAARARLDRDETILHLCIKLNQRKSLKRLLEMIDDEEFVNAKDCEGNTILHLAVIGKRKEILKFVLEKKIDVNERNARGHTAKDMLPQSIEVSQKTGGDIVEMKSDLDKAKAKRGIYVTQDEWISRNRDALMVVISLIATIAFQAGVSPAGGVWQDNSDGHSAGEFVMAYHHPYWYNCYLVCSSLGFVASFATLLLLNSGLPIRKAFYGWILVVVMMLTIAFVVASYGISVFWVTPKKHRHTLTEITMPAIILLFIGIILLLLIHTCYFIISLISATKVPPSLTNILERSSSSKKASSPTNIQRISSMRGQFTRKIPLLKMAQKAKEKKAEEHDDPESQGQEAMPSEPSNFVVESNVGMCIKDEEDGCAEIKGAEMPKH